MKVLSSGLAASVLIADDHVPLRALLRPLLERGGFYVCADVGDAALAIDAAMQVECTGRRAAQRTMWSSNQLLIVGSREPQVYGLIDCVFTAASDGSAGSGFTPWTTG